MTLYGLLSAVLVSVCWLFVSAADHGTTSGSTAAPRPAFVTNSSAVNSTHGGGKGHGGLFKGLSVDSSMIQRALYVLIGITMIGVLYFLIRAVR